MNIYEIFINIAKGEHNNTKMECKYCKNNFSSKYSLRYHQKTAKYCIKIQGKRTNAFRCDFCKKTLSTKQNLMIHQSICSHYNKYLNNQKWEEEKKMLMKEYELRLQTTNSKIRDLQDQLINKDETIKELQDKLENIALKAVSRPTNMTKNTQINYINQLKPVTDEILLDNAQYLSIDHIMKGPKGYAQYALEYPLKDRLLCVDYSRRKVKFKDKDGNVITDPEMTGLATKFFNSIKDKNQDLILECSEKLKENFGDEIDTI
ncbi:MAG TPA: C2H2-type zinc finger protein, partial [Myxococcota bacterium]|nr:C2H2-type zinc finger protein [Myxococcota bacterium]